MDVVPERGFWDFRKGGMERNWPDRHSPLGIIFISENWSFAPEDSVIAGQPEGAIAESGGEDIRDLTDEAARVFVLIRSPKKFRRIGGRLEGCRPVGPVVTANQEDRNLCNDTAASCFVFVKRQAEAGETTRSVDVFPRGYNRGGNVRVLPPESSSACKCRRSRLASPPRMNPIHQAHYVIINNHTSIPCLLPR